MVRTRRILVVAFVAAALAADRVGAAAPVLRPAGMVVAARQLAGRLVVGFRRAVAPARLEPLRREESPRTGFMPPGPGTQRVLTHLFQFTPFRFRLPPPVL